MIIFVYNHFMESLGQQIKDLRQAKFPPLSQAELATELGISRNQIANYETNRTVPPTSLLRKLEEIFSLTAGQLNIPIAQLAPGHALQPVKLPNSPLINLIPYWGQVPCGEWERPADDPDLIQVSETIDPKGVIAVKVSGNSMAPRLMHGQTVVIKLDKTARDGVITLATNHQCELTLKVLTFTKGKWELHSINPEHGTVSAESWEILGYAIAVEEHDPQGIRP